MSLLTRPSVNRAPHHEGTARQLPDRTSLRYRTSLWVRVRLACVIDPRGGTVVLLPLLALAGVVQRIGLYSAPQRIDDEGTYVAQAWAVFHLGRLTHYTYWYDHPPLGWLQIAGWTQATGGFDRAPNAVAAGRELMLVLSLLSAALLWVLARRLLLPRWAAAGAVLLFSLSPLAVQFHRTVYLDNIATPWVLAAFVLALSPRRRLGAFAASAACLAVAVLTKETTALLLPALGLLLWQRSRGGTRRYAIAVSTTLFALIVSFYAVFAALKGEVLPGAARTSLVTGLGYQLAGRAASGSIFDPATLGHATVTIWTQLDVVLPALALAATPLAFAVRRLRAIALGMVIMLAMLVRPGYLPVPFVVLMLPFGALLVAGVAAAGWQRRGRLTPVTRGAVAVVTVAATVVAVPAWGAQLRGLMLAPLDAPMTEATAWIDRNVPRRDRILTDDALWVDLVTQGRAPGDVVWFYKPDTDPGVPKGAANYQWVVSTSSVRSDPASFPTLAEALQRSVPAALFGTGPGRVEIRRVLGPGIDATALAEQRAGAAAAGQQLVRNPALVSTAQARAALLSGLVDPRVLTVLAGLTSRHRITVDALPRPAPEAADGATYRAVRLTRIDGVPPSPGSPTLARLTGQLRQQSPTYRPTLDLLPGAADSPAALLIAYPLTP